MPRVSIGVPVYNGEASIATMIDALLAQTFSNFEIVISDNASTDATEEICTQYAARDSRIRYVRQKQNIGGEGNFKFVLDQARGAYFMWSACDDLRSPDFVALNVEFLDRHPDYVASTCPNRIADRPVVAFSIEGSVDERFLTFFDNGWASHGIFYAVMRTDVLRACPALGQSFFGADWAVDLFLASRGCIHRTEGGLLSSGAGGISSKRTVWKRYRTSWISWMLPFYRLSVYALAWSENFTFRQRFALVRVLLRLNLRAAYSQLHATLYPAYAEYIKPNVGLLARRGPPG